MIDSQVRQALEFYDRVDTVTTVRYPEAEQIILTGHSLGGYIARIVAGKNQRRYYTFAAPGLHESDFERWKIPPRPSVDGVNFIRWDDYLVGFVGQPLGATVILDSVTADRAKPIPRSQSLMANAGVAAARSARDVADAHSITLLARDLRQGGTGVILTREETEQLRVLRASGGSRKDVEQFLEAARLRQGPREPRSSSQGQEGLVPEWRFGTDQSNGRSAGSLGEKPPNEWIACGCPPDHQVRGRFVGGTLYHPPGIKCPPPRPSAATMSSRTGRSRSSDTDTTLDVAK